MPHIPIESKEPMIDNDRYSIYQIKWESQGQCVAMYPPAQFKLYKKGGPDWSVLVEARSDHLARQMAIDIGELFA